MQLSEALLLDLKMYTGFLTDFTWINAQVCSVTWEPP